MITAWQRPLGDIAEERLVRFGRRRFAISVSVREDDRGFCIEARCGRHLVSRIQASDRDGLSAAIAQAMEEAQARLMEAL